MDSFRIEILNPKALQLIKGMQDLNLIRVTEDPASELRTYLHSVRDKKQPAPDLDEITRIVEEVRTERYAKK